MGFRIPSLCLFLLLACGHARDADPRPDVLLISLDSVRRDALGCYGAEDRSVTPNLDRLAQSGILFENAIQQNATELTLWFEEGGLEEEGLEKEGLEDSVAQLFISDNGNGVSESNREHVFTPFFTTLREQGGTGLGLTIAQALIKQIDGSLSLVAGNGPTTFRLTLPLS